MEELASVPVRAGDALRDHRGRPIGLSEVLVLLRASVDEDVLLAVPLPDELRSGQKGLAPLAHLLALLERGVEDGGRGIGDAEVVVLLLKAVDRLLPEGRGAARRAAREESGILGEDLLRVHRLNRGDLRKERIWRLCHQSFPLRCDITPYCSWNIQSGYRLSAYAGAAASGAARAGLRRRRVSSPRP